MWFKTRVGLTGLGSDAPVDVLVGSSVVTGTEARRWYVYARVLYQQDGSHKTLIGRASWTNPVLYLAMFSDGETVQHDIAACLVRIEEALRARATVCDLSDMGDAAAWGANWKQVDWPRQAPPGR